MPINPKRKYSVTRKMPELRWVQAAMLCGLVTAALLVTASSARAADRIYWSNLYGNVISYTNLDGSGGGDLPINPATLDGPMGLAIDTAASKIYWSNYGFNVGGNGTTIGVANLDGSHAQVLPITGGLVMGPHGVAIDSAAGKIYWANHDSNTGNSWIGYANLDGSNGGILNPGSADMEEPRGLAIDPAAGKIYWANWFGNTISFANLNGSGGANLNTGGATINNPEGVALDRTGGRLYYGNFSSADRIAYINLDGSGSANLDTSPVTPQRPHGVAIDPVAGRIYWPNFDANTISFANLGGGGGGDLPTSGALGPDLPVLLEAPVGARRPAISRAPGRGSTLKCTDDTWAPDLFASLLYRAPQDFSYQWSEKGHVIARATSRSIPARSVGIYRCQVTAENVAGAHSQTSPRYAFFKIGKPKLDKYQGTARLAVTVPPGRETLTLSGKGVVKRPAGHRGRASSALARRPRRRTVELLVKAKGKAKKRLNRTGKVKVKVHVTDTARGGSPDSQTKTVKLKKTRR